MRQLTDAELGMVSGGFITANGVTYTEDEWNNLFNNSSSNSVGNTDIFSGMLGYDQNMNSMSYQNLVWAQQWSSWSAQQTQIDHAITAYEKAQAAQQVQATVDWINSNSVENSLGTISAGFQQASLNPFLGWSLGGGNVPYVCLYQEFDNSGNVIRADTYSLTIGAAFNAAKMINSIPTSATPFYQTSQYDQSLFAQHGMPFSPLNGRGWVYETSNGFAAIRFDFAVTYSDGGFQGPHFNSGSVGVGQWNLPNHSYWGALPPNCLALLAL